MRESLPVRASRTALVLGMMVLASATLPLRAQPVRVHEWMREDTSALRWDGSVDPFGKDADAMRGYAVDGVASWNYQRGSEMIRVTMVRTGSPLDAFGLLGVRAGTRRPYGTVGDARLDLRGELLFAYGPFYCELVQRGRTREHVDESVADGLRRWMYTQADCHLDDIPLPEEERVLGTERLLRGSGAWRAERRRLPDEVRTELTGRQVWVATYRKQRLPVERTLWRPVTTGTADARRLTELLVKAFSEAGRPVRVDCGTQAWTVGSAVWMLFRDGARLLLVRSEASDTGCCWWIRDLYPAAQ